VKETINAAVDAVVTRTRISYTSQTRARRWFRERAWRVAICERVAKNIFTTKARYRVPRCVDARAPVHMAQQATYSAVESSDLPPQRWSTGVFECVSDPQVCVMGACPMGCVQYLYAANADSAGVEPFETAFFKACGLTVVVPNVIGAVAATAPAVGAALSPLNTLTSIALAWFGMSNRSYMRRRYNIRGVSECAWACSCFSFMFDGDEEKTDDFCCYLCCFSCAVCQETRTLAAVQPGHDRDKVHTVRERRRDVFRTAGGWVRAAGARGDAEGSHPSRDRRRARESRVSI
jgi:Cys-rich protein (TIGR01571 family)